MNMAGVPTNTSKGLYIFCYVSLISSAKLDQNTKFLILLRNQIYCSKYRISQREEITHEPKAKVLDVGAEFNEPALCVCLSVCVRDS